MTPGSRDVAQIRLANALALFDEFVHANVKSADAATLRGLEGRFAERLQIQPSYWSQIKGRSRQIGERLARQFEQLMNKPFGWMDEVHGEAGPAHGKQALAGFKASRAATGGASKASDAADDDLMHNVPRDDDERFIVGLVLTYYRRHPQRARSRLLDLLGEVLTPPPEPPGPPRAPKPPVLDDGGALWSRTQAAVAPLKRKR